MLFLSLQMGAVASSWHDVCGHDKPSPLIRFSPPSNCSDQFDTPIAKKPRLSLIGKARELWDSSSKAVLRLCQYPETKLQLKREVHAPYRVQKFGSASNSITAPRFLQSGIRELVSGEATMGNVCGRKYEVAKEDLLQAVKNLNKEPDIHEDDSSDDLSFEVVENVEDQSVISDHRLQEPNQSTVIFDRIDGKIMDEGIVQASSSHVSQVTEVEDAETMLKSLSLSPECSVDNVPVHKRLLESATRHDSKLHRLHSDIQLQEKLLESYRSLRLEKGLDEQLEPVDSAHLQKPFVPLNEEDEEAVAEAFSFSNRRKVIVTHEGSNIEITGQMLQCLRPGAWLNDEVINVYLELLKERERREPKKFLKCHFFNTFFYKKLTGGRNGYDYKSVRRWTTQKKLGYGLIECDKIFVPIHKEVHWCLAVINNKDQKFHYLDSLGGRDIHVLELLARYFVDEVNEKSNQDIDVAAWERDFVTDLPEQENGYDCGMFMIKYVDFYSRGMGLNFSQEHMPYFRKRTAKEILQLRAD